MTIPFLETAACSQLMETMASRFLTLLGWKHAMTGDKGVPFQQVFTVLGAELVLTDLSLGKILVSNKPGRLERTFGATCQRTFSTSAS